MIKKLALVFGVVFVVVGLLGFVKNPIIGATGLFRTDMLHNLVHIIIGAVLVWASTAGEAKSAMYLKVFGVVYLVLAVLGFLMPGDKLLGLVAVNMADHWLHLVLGVVLLAVSMMKPSVSVMAKAPGTM